MSASEKANLARIRDNQRRSRARRKEYLQELEARLRQCELQGIEASSEIQQAARRVADENKKLRGLLAQHGVRDDSIKALLQSSEMNTMMGEQFDNGSSSGAVQNLEHLLATRKQCCADGSTPIATTMRGSRDSSATSISTVKSTLWEPIHPRRTKKGRRRSDNTPSMGKAASSIHQFMTPSSTTSRTSSVSLGHSTSRGVQPQRMALPRNTSPASNPSRHTPQLFDFDTQLSLSNSPSYNSPHHHAQQRPHYIPQRSSIYMPTTTSSSSGTNSCVFATDMITTMAGGDPNSIIADLGCSPGMDCEVDNHLVFNVMDQYTGTTVGL
jgi:hypothetical protein